jgi:hypothetical protein
MNNPFANFDLELFLENFPDVVRQPMPLAIGASVLAHGLFFLGLPVVTGASDKTEKPERIVNVIELSSTGWTLTDGHAQLTERQSREPLLRN